MKYKLLILLISLSVNSYGITYNYKDYLINMSGFVNYGYATSDINPSNNDFSVVINGDISNNSWILSSQVSNNPYNPLRRLMISTAIYTTDTNQFELNFGRMTIPVGFINTSTTNSFINGSILLPLSTYDPRRYLNLPDIVDGLAINDNIQVNDRLHLKLKAYVGKPVIDNPLIDVYDPGFSFIVKGNIAFGFNAKICYDDTVIRYSYTDSEGTVNNINPPFFKQIIDLNTYQHMHFFGIQQIIDDFKIQSEVTYRQLNASTNVVGQYSTVSYNFIDKWKTYIGESYGYRENDTTKLFDAFVGVADTFNNITVAIEYHRTITNNWNFNYTDPIHRDINTILTSITYMF
jgi:hypothetical protein